MNRPGSLGKLILLYELIFLSLVLLTGLLVGLSAYTWNSSAAESLRLNRLLHLGGRSRGELSRQVQQMIRARALEEPTAVEAYLGHSRTIDELFNRMRSVAADRAEQEVVQKLQVHYRVLQQDMNKVLEDPYNFEATRRIRMLDPRFAGTMIGTFEALYKDFRLLLIRRIEHQQALRNRWTRAVPVVVPVVLIIGVLLVLYSRRMLQHGFVQPMQRLIQGAGLIRGGDLEHRIKPGGVDEVNALAQAINRMSADLASSRDALMQKERDAALGALVPVVAHNVRNPLAGIRALAQVLDGSEDRRELGETRQAIIDTIDRLERWVSALVSYLHPLRPQLRAVEAQRLLQAPLELLGDKLEAKDIVLRCHGWEQGVRLQADPDLAEQAMYGLLANAIEASAGGAELVVGMRHNGDEVELYIQDQGCGLPFDPKATELTPGPTTKRFGTGLGIPVAFKICQVHGWRLQFQRPPQGGTRVSVTAALTAAPAEAADGADGASP